MNYAYSLTIQTLIDKLSSYAVICKLDFDHECKGEKAVGEQTVSEQHNPLS